MNTPTSGHSRLEHFPIALFATVMGTAGLALAWQKASLVIAAPLAVGTGIRWFASLLFIFLLLLYLSKSVRYPGAIKEDFAHPVKLNFFPAISIGLLLLAVAWAKVAPGLAFWLWVIGAIAHLVFTMLAMNSWIYHEHYQITHATPAWFIPVVGNVIVPIAGVQFAPADISWFFFSIGIVFWLVLMTIVMYRLFFHQALPKKLFPTLFILIAPPAAGFLSYMALTDSLDNFARVLYFTSLFLAILLGMGTLRFLRLPFFISAWASSFPLAALTIASLEMAAHSQNYAFYAWLSMVLLALVSLLVLVLIFKTLQLALRGQICIPE